MINKGLLIILHLYMLNKGHSLVKEIESYSQAIKEGEEPHHYFLKSGYTLKKNHVNQSMTRSTCKQHMQKFEFVKLLDYHKKTI